MALLSPKKEKESPAEKVTAEVTTLVPPVKEVVAKPVALVMGTDGGLNGKCWRAGEVVMLDPEAADFYLAKGHAARVK
jgi:hypothetical protein